MSEIETWEAWARGESRCPYCVDLTDVSDFAATCDCDQFEREYPDFRWPDDPMRFEIDGEPVIVTEVLEP